MRSLYKSFLLLAAVLAASAGTAVFAQGPVNYLPDWIDYGGYIGLRDNPNVKFYDTGAAVWQTTTDSTTAYQWLDADGGAPVLNINTTDERVGIRTNAPSGPLDVAHDTDVITYLGRSVIGSSTSDWATFAHYDQATLANGAVLQNSAGSTILNAPTGGNVSLALNGTSVLRLTGGKIGISTTAPDRLFEINMGTSGYQRWTYNDADGSATTYGEVTIGSDGQMTWTTVDPDGASGNITFSPDGIVVITPSATIDGGYVGTRGLTGSWFMGVDAGLSSSGTYCTNSGYRGLQNNTGNNCTNSGSQGLEYNTGAYCTNSGYRGLQNNTGTNCTNSGYYGLYYNAGAYCTNAGADGLEYNTGIACTNAGAYGLAYNTGASCTNSGYRGLYNNTGTNCTNAGAYGLHNNDSDYATSVGRIAFNAFNENAGAATTFDYTAVNATTDYITVTAHSFGATGSYINLKFTEGTSTLPGLTTATVYLFKIIDADTLYSVTNITAVGTGTGHTLTPRYVYDNSTALGYNAEPDAGNQVMLGDTNVTQVKSTGAGIFLASYSTDLNGTTFRDAQIKDDGTIGYDSSSIVGKTNVVDVPDETETIMALRPVLYDPKKRITVPYDVNVTVTETVMEEVEATLDEALETVEVKTTADVPQPVCPKIEDPTDPNKTIDDPTWVAPEPDTYSKEVSKWIIEDGKKVKVTTRVPRTVETVTQETRLRDGYRIDPDTGTIYKTVEKQVERTRTIHKSRQEYIDESVEGMQQYGLIAEEVEQIDPNLVFYNEDGSIAGVHYGKPLVVLMLKQLQAQQKQIEDLEARVTVLEKK